MSLSTSSLSAVMPSDAHGLSPLIAAHFHSQLGRNLQGSRVEVNRIAAARRRSHMACVCLPGTQGERPVEA